MKFNKSALCIAFALFLCNSFNLFSQYASATQNELGAESKPSRVGFQVRGGLTISNIAAIDGRDNYHGDARVGYNINALMDVDLGKGVFLLTGAGVISKGAIFEDIGGGRDITIDATYLRVPVYVGWRLNIPSFSKNFATAATGLYGAYGIAGKMKQDGAWGDEANTFSTFGLNRFDMGIGIELTFELNRFIFAVTGEYGFINVSDKYKGPLYPSDLTWLNQSFSLNVGYRF